MGERRARDLVDTVWDSQSVWSQTADLLKARLDRLRLRLLMLALAVASAVLTTAAVQVVPWQSGVGRVLAVAAGVSIGLVPLVRARLGREAVSRWTRARAVAEELKAEVLPFLAGVTPYRGADRATVLAERTTRVQTEAADLLPHTVGVSPVPREVPAVFDVGSYVEMRLLPQIGWYRRRADGLVERLGWARRVEVLLSAAAWCWRRWRRPRRPPRPPPGWRW